MKRITGAAIVAVLLTVMAGCGGGDGDSAEMRKLIELEFRVKNIEESLKRIDAAVELSKTRIDEAD